MEKATQGASQNLTGHWHYLCHPLCAPEGAETEGLGHYQASGSDEEPVEETEHGDSFLGLHSSAQPQCSMWTVAAPSASCLPVLMKMAWTLDALHLLQTVCCIHTELIGDWGRQRAVWINIAKYFEEKTHRGILYVPLIGLLTCFVRFLCWPFCQVTVKKSQGKIH